MIRENVRLAQKFEALVRSDSRFEIPAARHMGMVVFRLRGECSMTEKLLKKLNSRYIYYHYQEIEHTILFGIIYTNEIF